MNCKTETLHGEFYFAVLDLIGGFDQRATLREVKVAHKITVNSRSRDWSREVKGAKPKWFSFPPRSDNIAQSRVIIGCSTRRLGRLINLYL
jgi:hypothetical protein